MPNGIRGPPGIVGNWVRRCRVRDPENWSDRLSYLYLVSYFIFFNFHSGVMAVGAKRWQNPRKDPGSAGRFRAMVMRYYSTLILRNIVHSVVLDGRKENGRSDQGRADEQRLFFSKPFTCIVSNSAPSSHPPSGTGPGILSLFLVILSFCRRRQPLSPTAKSICCHRLKVHSRRSTAIQQAHLSRSWGWGSPYTDLILARRAERLLIPSRSNSHAHDPTRAKLFGFHLRNIV